MVALTKSILHVQSMSHTLTVENVEAALRKSRPSLSAAEQKRLMRIYDRFQSGRSSGLKTEEPHLKFDPLGKNKKPVQRATLG